MQEDGPAASKVDNVPSRGRVGRRCAAGRDGRGRGDRGMIEDGGCLPPTGLPSDHPLGYVKDDGGEGRTALQPFA